MNRESDVEVSYTPPHQPSRRMIPKQNSRFGIYAMTFLKDLYNYGEIPSHFDLMQYATSMSSYSKMKPGWLSANTIDVAPTAIGAPTPQVYTTSEKTPLNIQGATEL